MNARVRISGTLVKRVGAMALVLAIVGLGYGWRRLVLAEAAQAQGFVDEAHSALADGDRGAAVLALERARWLAPRASIVRSALEASGVTDVEPTALHVSRLLTSEEWLAIATVGGWTCGLGVGFLLLRRQSPLKGAVAAVAFATGAVCAVAAGALAARAACPLAVVKGGDAGLLIAPYSTATLQTPLPSGALVIVGPEFGGFRHVRVAGGATGWVAEPKIEDVALSGG